jgi:type VI secretion system secreted protein VgrG
MPLTQRSRLLAINTALGPDVLVLRSIAMREQISRLFEIDADLSSENGAIDFDKVVGHNATVRLELANKATRYFNGFVSRFVQVGNKDGYAHYRATLVPWLWFLTRTADCRIFQEKKIPEIIEEVFKGHGFTDYQLKLSGNYEKWEYCVQYRETDFNFVSRLMEQAGIYYFFSHENGKHLLVLADSASAHNAFPGYEEIVFSELDKGAAPRERVTDWTMEKEVQTGAYALNDFDFKKPKASLRSSSSVSRQHGASQFEIYDYPGEYVENGEGGRLAKVRIEELQAQHDIRHGQASALGLASGNTFKLKNHPRVDQNKEYLVTRVRLAIDAGEFGSGGGGEGDFFSCDFSVIEKAQPYRALRLTPKPIVQGLQTAIVVGPKGEEIYTDKFGRVKVQFHWDRYAKADENSSCWIRVSQGWAGKQWGAIYIPRIGQEVIVEFLEGDPDRPLITGRVYNGEAMPPYDLPAEKTKSTLKSNSSKGGAGFNEIRFEDKKGSEQIYMHAEKDQDITVKHDRKERIGRDRHLVVKGNKLERIFGERHERVGKSHIEKILKDRNLDVTGNDSVLIKGVKSVAVKGDVVEVFKSNHSEEVTADYYLKAKNIVIEAEQNITIKVGGSHIVLEASGIKIGTTGEIKVQSTGPTAVKATGPLSLESAAKADMKSPMTTVKGDAMVTVQGGLVKIN